MFSSKTPSVLGLVSIRQATSSDDLGAEVVHLDPAALVGRELDHLVAGHRHRGRVGAVGGVGGQHLGALLAAVRVVGAGQQQPGELAVGAGRGLEADVRQPADLRQRLLQEPHQLQRALGAARVLGGVQAGVPGQRRDPLVEPRVVLHRARAQRVEAGVEVEVAPREPVVVADDLGLGDLGQPRRLGAEQVAGISSSSGRSGTPGSGITAARRPGFERSKIVTARSRCWRVSARLMPLPRQPLASRPAPRPRAPLPGRRSARRCGAR